MDKVRLQELAEFQDDAQTLADIARIDAIIKKGSYTSTK